MSKGNHTLTLRGISNDIGLLEKPHWDRPQLDLQFSCLVLPLSLSIHTYICNYIHVFRDITRSCRADLHVTPIRRLGTFVE